MGKGKGKAIPFCHRYQIHVVDDDGICLTCGRYIDLPPCQYDNKKEELVRDLSEEGTDSIEDTEPEKKS